MSESVTQTLEVIPGFNGKMIKVLKMVVVHAADKSLTDTYIQNTAGANLWNEIKGMWLYKVRTLYGTTPPTDDTDLYLYDSDGFDILGGAGVNSIDNATNNEFVPLIGGSPAEQLMVDRPYIDVNNNDEANATYTLKFYLREQ